MSARVYESYPPGRKTALADTWPRQLLASHRLARIASQSWRFVALEVWVISAKKEALQALSVPQNVVWNTLAFRAEEIDESVDRGGDTL